MDDPDHRPQTSPADRDGGEPRPPAAPAPFALLAQSRLYVASSDGPPRPVDSAFGEAVRERAVQIQRRHEWKEVGRGARFMSRGLLWGMPDQDGATMRVAVTGLSRGAAPGELVYTLEAGGVGGVLSLRLADLLEKRLRHGNQPRLRYLAAAPGRDLLVCSVGNPDGTANLAVLQADGTALRTVTEGDCIDIAPSWVPGPGSSVVYQSAGIGRDRAGAFVELAPFAVHRIDLERGEVATLAQDAAVDFLGPRLGPDGALYCIRRPRRPERPGGLWRSLLDVVLFVPRLLLALFHYLNFVSTAYSGKPLTTAGGPRKEGADVRRMMVWGNLIDAEEAARENAVRGDTEPPAVVPRSWKLVRRPPDGPEEVLAAGVVSFDLASDGTVLYTTGSAVYRLDAARTRTRLLAQPAIEQVVALW